jgi:hypothetical protein
MGPHAFRMVRAVEKFREPRGRLDHRPLLDDPAVRKWFEAHALRSSLSAEVNLRKLGLFLYRTRLTPKRLVELAKERPAELRDLLIGYATHLHALKKLDSYIAKTQKGVRDWLLFNGVDFRQFPKLRRAYQSESLARERVPTPEQLRLILGALPPRGRACALLMAHSGLRPGTLGNDQGNDGLALGDLPELRTDGKHPLFELPAGRKAFLVRVPSRLSKNSWGYLTFGTPEAADAILSYLGERQAEGETLTPSSPLVALTALGARNTEGKETGSYVTTKSVVYSIRKAIQSVCPENVRWRPYVLRSYCSTQLLVGRMDHDTREAILGHDLGVAGRYNLRKQLPDHVVDAMREEYERAMGALLTARGAEESRATEGFVRILLRSLGLPEDTDVSQMSETDRAELADRLSQRLIPGADAVTGASGDGAPIPSPTRSRGSEVQRIVTLAEVAGLLEQGWSAVMPLDGGRFILQPPRTDRLG